MNFFDFFHSTNTSKKIDFAWYLHGGTIPQEFITASYLEVDLFETSKKDLERYKGYSIAYFSAGSWEPNRPDSEQLKAIKLGNPLDGWEKERWLDIRNTKVREIMLKRIILAKEKGFYAIETDNTNAYEYDSNDSNIGDHKHPTGFNIKEAEQIEYNIWLAKTAHQHGLKIVHKNSPYLVKSLEKYFDLALVEDCAKWSDSDYDECLFFKPFHNAKKPVFFVEYPKENETEADFEKRIQNLKKANPKRIIIGKKIDLGTYFC